MPLHQEDLHVYFTGTKHRVKRSQLNRPAEIPPKRVVLAKPAEYIVSSLTRAPKLQR